MINKIKKIQEHITLCDKLLSRNEHMEIEIKELQDMIAGVYVGEIPEIYDILENPNNSFTNYNNTTYRAEAYLRNITLLKEKLENHICNLELSEKQRSQELELARLKAQPINVSQSNSQSNAQNQNINVSITIDQVFEAIKQIPNEILPQENKDELEDKISAVEAAKNSKDKVKLSSKIGAVLKYIVDKGIEVGIAVLPYLGEIAKLYKEM